MADVLLLPKCLIAKTVTEGSLTLCVSSTLTERMELMLTILAGANIRIIDEAHHLHLASTCSSHCSTKHLTTSSLCALSIRLKGEHFSACKMVWISGPFRKSNFYVHGSTRAMPNATSRPLLIFCARQIYIPVFSTVL